MALGVRKFFQHLDLLGSEIRNVLLHKVAGNPGSPAESQVWYDDTANRVKYQDDAGVKTVAHTGELSAGSVTAVTGTLPITSSGGTAPDIAINAASGSAAGSQSSAHFTLVNGATAAATASTLVQRDASSRFAAADPSAATDVATKQYVDAVAAGVRDVKDSVRVATTAAGTLASSFENGDTIDGVVLATGNRILIKDQAAGAENGIYTVNASGAPTRATDADTSAEVTGGMYVWVNEGTANADSGWLLTTNDPITVGTTALVFTQVSGLGQISATAPITKTGNTLSFTGGFGLTNGGAIDKTLVPIFKTGLVGGAGPATSYTITNPGFAADRRIMVEIIEEATGETVEVGIGRAASGNVTVDFGTTSVAGTDYRYMMTGLAA
jgi:hypothetical protein